MFYWFEPVLFLDPVAKFPETTEKEKPGFFVGFADNVGDALTFKISKNDLSAVSHRSVVRSTADPMHRNNSHIQAGYTRGLEEALLDQQPILCTETRQSHSSRIRKRS
jgi:hypothetical protein